MESTASMASASTMKPQNATCAFDTAQSTGPLSASPCAASACTIAGVSTSWKLVSQKTASPATTRSLTSVTASRRGV